MVSPYRAHETLPQPPRAIERRRELPRVAFWRARLRWWPALMAPLAVVVWWSFLVVIWLFGQTAEGHIVAVERGAAGSPRVEVSYAYEDHGRIHRHARSVDASGDQASLLAGVAAGDVVTVRHFSWGEARVSDVDLPRETGGFRRARNLVQVGLLALFVSVAVGFFTSPAWSAALRQRRLLRLGVAVTGTVIGHDKAAGRERRIAYTYTTPDGEQCEGLVSPVDPSLASSLREGDRALVLYDARDPKVSCLYEVCVFRWTEA